MDGVYRNAEEVLAWLGEESEDSELALDTIEESDVGIIDHTTMKEACPT
jgi:hypothetical protein